MHTAEQILEMIDFYLDAEVAVLKGKTITKGDRTWGREDLAEIRRGRQEWEYLLKLKNSTAKQRAPSVVRFD